LKASQDFFNGKHFNSTATEGLGSYLDYLKTIRNGEQLSSIINKQFTYYFTATALNASFSTQVTTDNAKMILAYDALQQCHLH
jgi:hypothetical protein